MDKQRQRDLDVAGGRLTPEEVAEGWHYCPDWDQMLVGPGTPNQLNGCTCRPLPKDPQ